jgi:hypothetical protein
MQDNERTNVLAALQQAETKERPPLDTMFEDVYDVKLPHLLVRWASRVDAAVGELTSSTVCVTTGARARDDGAHCEVSGSLRGRALERAKLPQRRRAGQATTSCFDSFNCTAFLTPVLLSSASLC